MRISRCELFESEVAIRATNYLHDRSPIQKINISKNPISESRNVTPRSPSAFTFSQLFNSAQKAHTRNARSSALQGYSIISRSPFGLLGLHSELLFEYDVEEAVGEIGSGTPGRGGRRVGKTLRRSGRIAGREDRRKSEN